MNIYEKLRKNLAETPEGCLEWQGTRWWSGYGRIFTARPERRPLRAHRVAWEEINGAIPEGLVIRHTCDNRLCCNPSHLLLGTRGQNITDMVERKRQARGERVSSAKLTAGHVAIVRARLRAGHPQREIAEDMGVSRSLIRLIGRRELWREVA